MAGPKIARSNKNNPVFVDPHPTNFACVTGYFIRNSYPGPFGIFRLFGIGRYLLANVVDLASNGKEVDLIGFGSRWN